MGDNIDSSNNPLSFFEEFFPDGFNKMYDEFLHFDRQYDKIKYEIIDRCTYETYKFFDGTYKLITDKSDISTLIGTNWEFFPDGDLECNLPSPKIIESDLEFDLEKDSMLIEKCYCSSLPDCDIAYVCAKEYHKISFKKGLETTLNSELKNAIKITDDAILQKNNKEVTQEFIHKLFLNATRIINHKISVIDKITYILDCQSVLTSYIQEIENHYPDYVSREKSLYLQYLPPKIPKKNCALKMISSKFERLHILLGLLKKDEFVEQDLSLDLFKRAFDGKELTESLKIKWTKIYYGKCNYTSALEMVQQMENKKYIADYNYSQLSLIFVQNDGSPIKEVGWKEASSRKKKEKKISSRYTPSDDIQVIIHNF